MGKIRPSLDGLVKTFLPTPTASNIDWQEYEPAIRRWKSVLGRSAPYPAARGPRGGIKVAPAFGEWLMGLPAGHITSVPNLTLNQQLKLIGNGVLPQQAEYAIQQLTIDSKENDMTSANDTSSFFTRAVSRDVPRDQWKRYVLPDPDTGETIKGDGWTRATTFAATIAESYALQIWKQRQVVWGLSRRPDLITMASTIAGPEDKQALGRIVDEAHIAAGTEAKANRGTAIHLACAAAERGAYHEVPEELRPHVAGYFAEMKRHRLQVIPKYVERTVISKRYHVAGTFDNLVLCPDGKIRVADKKTGSLDYADIEFAIQLALYANADLMFNYATGEYEPMPEIAKDYAIVMHIDPETGHTEAQRVAIDWGWVWTRTCAEVMDIRRTKHVITPLVVNETFAENKEAFGPTGIGENVQAFAPPQFVDTPPASNGHAPLPTNTAVFAMNSGPIPAPPTPQFVMPSITGTVPGGFVDSTSPVLAAFQAFWSDDRHDLEPDIDDTATVNGVPLAQYGQRMQWPCSSETNCVPVTDDGLHPDGTICHATEHTWPLIGNTPSPIEITQQAADMVKEIGTMTMAPMQGTVGSPYTEEESAPEMPPGEAPPDDEMVSKIIKQLKTKAAVQGVARELMNTLGIKESDPDGIRLNQYKEKLANASVTLAYRRGVEVPGFGQPKGPGNPVTDTKRAASSISDTSIMDKETSTKIRVAVASIRQATSLEQLQKLHADYSKTSIGWTDEMQNAARTRAAELDQESGESTLTPLEMINGATSRETMTKAWNIATSNGTDMSGWTEELNAAAMAKDVELATAAVATSGNQ